MNTTALRKVIAVIFLLSLIVLYGCAGRPIIPKGQPLYAVKNKAFFVGNTKYVDVGTFSKNYGTKWQWDIFSYRLVLRKDNHIATLIADSNIILADGRIVHLKETPIFHDSQFLIPLSAIERPLDQVFYSSYKLPVREQTHIIDTIVIDPGHGGKDPGAIGITGLREKDVNLDISKLLKRRLQAEGINVILTRSCDKFLSLWQRAHIANEEKADFFISIHANASRSRQASGFEVYYLSEACDDSARAVQASENAALDFETDFKIKTSDQLKATLWDIIYTENRVESIELAQSLVNSMDNAKISRNRGVKSALFYVLKGTRIPSVLIEVGFISNRYEETKLKKSSYRQEIADCIAEGILNYKKRYELTDGFTN